MNLFITSKSAKKSAEYLSQDSVRLNKQIVECGQLLAYAGFNNGCPKKYLPYNSKGEHYKTKTSHKFHKVTKWVEKSFANYQWTLDFMLECHKLFNKPHKTICNISLFRFIGNNFIPAGELTDFCNDTPYKNIPVFKAYKKHLNDKWNIKK